MILESKKSTFSAKYIKKMMKYEEILFGSTLAEELFISILEEGECDNVTEDVLNNIFECGIKTLTEISPHFIETVKSFYSNGFDSPPLKTLIGFLKNQNLLTSPTLKESKQHRNKQAFTDNDDDHESNETL